MITAETRRHTEAEFQRMSSDICQHLLANETLYKANTVLAFWPMPSEPDIRPLIRQLYCEGKTVLLPRVTSSTEMEFCIYTGDDSLQQVPPYGIFEPSGMAVMDLPKDAVMLVPGVAFDAEGHRLGHGCGYYDRYLSQHPMPTIPVCFPFQMVPEVPTAPHDIRIGH